MRNRNSNQKESMNFTNNIKLLLKRKLNSCNRFSLNPFGDRENIVDNMHSDPNFNTRLNLLNQSYINHRPSNATLDKQKETTFKINPKFSIVVPLYNTPDNFFNEMVASVCRQTYSNLELILINASPENEDLKNLVIDACDNDPRIVSHALNQNEGIMKNTNAGIKLATGDYVCFLDHDDVLEPDILFHYTRSINDRNGKADLLYCDDIILDEDGKVAGTFLIGDFSIDALLHRNYVGHMLCIKKLILDNIPTDTSEFDGAQDHYMTLMASLQTSNIVHVNRALYKWRRTPDSTSANANSKTYATDAGIKAVQLYLDKAGIEGKVRQANRPFSYAVDYKVYDSSRITAIIDATKTLRNIHATLQTLSTLQNYRNTEIFIIGTEANNYKIRERLNNKDNISFIEARDAHDYSRAVNMHTDQYGGNFLLFATCNILLKYPNELHVLLGRAQRKDIGAVGPKLIYQDGTIMSTGIIVATPKPNHINRGLSSYCSGYMDFADCEHNYIAVSGDFMLTNKDKFIEVDGLNEEYSRFYIDVDYCLRLRDKGYLNLYTPQASVTNFGEFMLNTNKNNEFQLVELNDRAKLIQNWEEYFKNGDPYINDNFDNSSPDGFRFIPRI